MYFIPASFAVLAHWSVLHFVALKNSGGSSCPVHSVPENVLNDQHMNMPNRMSLISSALIWSGVFSVTIFDVAPHPLTSAMPAMSDNKNSDLNFFIITPVFSMVENCLDLLAMKRQFMIDGFRFTQNNG